MTPYDENLLAAYATARLIVETIEALIPAAQLVQVPMGVCEISPEGIVSVRFTSPLDLHAGYEQREVPKNET